jgi:hypothetical protein
VFVEAEVQALIHETLINYGVNFSENDVINYTYGSVMRHVQSSLVFTEQVSRQKVMKIVELFITLQTA